MNTTQTVVLIAHTFIAVMIIVLVLLQRGKGADAGAAFGSGASGTVFGARGSANFFSRATAILATAFFASSLALAYLSSQTADRPESLIERAPAVVPEEVPGDGFDDGFDDDFGDDPGNSSGNSSGNEPAESAAELPALVEDGSPDTEAPELPAMQQDADEPVPDEDDPGTD